MKENYFGKYEQMSIEELQNLEQSLKDKKYKVDKSAVTFLKNNKQAFIQGYSKEELQFAVNQVFEYFDDTLFSIQFINISKNWNPHNDSSVKPLHPDLITKFADVLIETTSLCYYRPYRNGFTKNWVCLKCTMRL